MCNMMEDSRSVGFLTFLKTATHYTYEKSHFRLKQLKKKNVGVAADNSSTVIFTQTTQSFGFTDDASNRRKYPVSCTLILVVEG